MNNKKMLKIISYGLLVGAIITLVYSVTYIVFNYEWLRQCGIILMYMWVGCSIVVVYILIMMVRDMYIDKKALKNK